MSARIRGQVWATAAVLVACMVMAGCVGTVVRLPDGSRMSRLAFGYNAELGIAITNTNGQAFKVESYRGSADAKMAEAMGKLVDRIPTAH